MIMMHLCDNRGMYLDEIFLKFFLEGIEEFFHLKNVFREYHCVECPFAANPNHPGNFVLKKTHDLLLFLLSYVLEFQKFPECKISKSIMVYHCNELAYDTFLYKLVDPIADNFPAQSDFLGNHGVSLAS